MTRELLRAFEVLKTGERPGSEVEDEIGEAADDCW
jgi:hypothetical protein